MSSNNYGQGYQNGKRFALVQVLTHCLRELGYNSPEHNAHIWIIERERTVAALRELCAEVGDNDWADELDLSDVIEKHLARHFAAGK